MAKLTKSLIFFLALIGLCINLNGCAYFKRQTPIANINLTFTSSQDLNPNIFERASPLYITIFQLQGVTAFNQASSFTLLNMPEQAIGQSLILKTNMMILPNTTRNVVLALDKDTRQLGIVAAFTQIKNARWRLVIPITKANKKIFIKFTKTNMIIERSQ